MSCQFLFNKPLFSEFAIVSTFRAYRQDPGWLFAVVNPFQTVVQFGLQMQDRGGSEQTVVLYYTPNASSSPTYVYITISPDDD